MKSRLSGRKFRESLRLRTTFGVSMNSSAVVSAKNCARSTSCSTAEIKISDLADESLHLASSFQVAGFRHTVASMWPSSDAISAQVAKLFYQDLLTNGSIKAGDRASCPCSATCCSVASTVPESGATSLMGTVYPRRCLSNETNGIWFRIMSPAARTKLMVKMADVRIS